MLESIYTSSYSISLTLSDFSIDISMLKSLDNMHSIRLIINSEGYGLISLSQLLHSMNPFNLNIGNSNYYPLTLTNLTCFPNTSIINLNNTISNFNVDISNINYCYFSSLNFYSSPDFYYYTLFSFFFTHRFILLPVILLFLYYLKDLFINSFPSRTDNLDIVDIRESQGSSSSTVPNSVGNQSQGSNASASGASGGGGNGGSGGNGGNGGNGGSGNNN